MDWAKAVCTNIDIVAKVESINFDVMLESMRVGSRLGMPRIQRETKKYISD